MIFRSSLTGDVYATEWSRKEKKEDEGTEEEGRKEKNREGKREEGRKEKNREGKREEGRRRTNEDERERDEKNARKREKIWDKGGKIHQEINSKLRRGGDENTSQTTGNNENGGHQEINSKLGKGSERKTGKSSDLTVRCSPDKKFWLFAKR